VERDPQPAVSSEADLVARLRAGDDDAYEELVRTHAGRVFAVVRRYVASDEDARDVVQEAFLSAFRAMDRFEGASRLSTWLHRIAVNAALMHLRRKAARPEEAIDDLLPRFSEDGHREGPAATWDLPDGGSADAALTRAFVRQAIDRLPDGYRAVLLLRDIEGLSTEETARLLATTAGAVKVRLHRARQALRELLDRRFAGEDGR